MNDGWISLHRKLRENPIYQNSKALHVWIECLLRARHKKGFVYAKRQKIELLPGMFLAGRKEFGESINMSGSTAWYWLLEFESDSMLDIKKTAKGSIITINNWDEYQEVDSTSDNKKTTNEQQKNTNNNVNNVNKKNTGIKNPAISNFKEKEDLFYKGYNRIRKLFIPNSRGINARDTKTRRQLKERLKEGYTVLQIENAIENMFLDDWHKQSKYKNSTPEFITRPDKLQKFFMLADQRAASEARKKHKTKLTTTSTFKPPSPKAKEARDAYFNLRLKAFDKKYGEKKWSFYIGREDIKKVSEEDKSAFDKWFKEKYPNQWELIKESD